MNFPVMPVTKQDQVVQVGRTTANPMHQVMAVMNLSR